MLSHAAGIESPMHPRFANAGSRAPVSLSRNKDWLAAFRPAIKRTRIYKRGETLFRSGDPFHALYAVNSGSVKIYTDCEDGAELVFSFYLPGELLGLESIANPAHSFSAVALENSNISEISYDALQELMLISTDVQRTVNRFYSREITQKCALLLLKSKDASERLASFLLNLGGRFAELGYSERRFTLSMTRFDIANYLGLASETISRLLTSFQQQQLLHVDKRTVEILNKQALQEAAGSAWYSLDYGSIKNSAALQ